MTSESNTEPDVSEPTRAEPPERTLSDASARQILGKQALLLRAVLERLARGEEVPFKWIQEALDALARLQADATERLQERDDTER